MKQRLDTRLLQQGAVSSRSQAETYIKLGKVKVNGVIITKPGFFVNDDAKIMLDQSDQYVSRAGLKLASVSTSLGLDFAGKTVLDVGSSTGGFTDYVLRHGAKKVFAVDVGTNQLHPSLHGNPKISLHEQTDIRDFKPVEHIDYVLIDVSFISLREILPHLVAIAADDTIIIAMCKPQFETGSPQKSKGIIKNDTMRRAILKDFETWAKQYFVLISKADSAVRGSKGNLERFYVFKKQKR